MTHVRLERRRPSSRQGAEEGALKQGRQRPRGGRRRGACRTPGLQRAGGGQQRQKHDRGGARAPVSRTSRRRTRRWRCAVERRPGRGAVAALQALVDARSGRRVDNRPPGHEPHRAADRDQGARTRGRGAGPAAPERGAHAESPCPRRRTTTPHGRRLQRDEAAGRPARPGRPSRGRPGRGRSARGHRSARTTPRSSTTSTHFTGRGRPRQRGGFRRCRTTSVPRS